MAAARMDCHDGGDDDDEDMMDASLSLSEQQGLSAFYLATHNSEPETVWEKQRRTQHDQDQIRDEQDKRSNVHVYVPPPETRFACKACGTETTDVNKMMRCGGGCVGHYLCNNACKMLDWMGPNQHKLSCMGRKKK